MTKWMRHSRPWEDCLSDYVRIRATWPQVVVEQDVTRGEQRFAAEAALAELHAELVPSWVHERAMVTLTVLARG